MLQLLMPTIALLAGAAIAVQASMNAQLGVLLKNPLLASSVAFFSSLIFTLATVAVFVKEMPRVEVIRTVPYCLWFCGGILSAFAISLVYWLIPRMGAGPMISYALTGQLLLAIITSHFGWFQLPVVPLSTLKIFGIFSLILGIVLINNG